jgi:hypothetical protein
LRAAVTKGELEFEIEFAPHSAPALGEGEQGLVTNAQPICRKCGAPITSSQNVLLPEAGGVQHVDCAKARKPLARVSDRAAMKCLICEQPLLPGDTTVLVGHDLFHAACRRPTHWVR